MVGRAEQIASQDYLLISGQVGQREPVVENGRQLIGLVRFREGDGRQVEEPVIGEMRLAIIVDGQEIVQLMCSPRRVSALVLGFLYHEGIIESYDDILAVRVCLPDGLADVVHKLLANLPDDLKTHWLQPGVGHYGVFNGSRFRAEIAPRIADFVLSHNFRHTGYNRARKSPAEAVLVASHAAS